MKKIYYTVETTDKNGIEEVAMFNTLEEAEEKLYSIIDCDDYLTTSYLNENIETETDVETENLISYDGKCVYERFSQNMYGDYYSSANTGEVLEGECHFVCDVADEEGYEWRGFTEDEWETVKHMTNTDIYKMFKQCEVIEC